MSSAWEGFYVPLPDGRSKITAAALIAIRIKDSLRVLDSLLEGVAAKILLLDKPMRVAEEVKESEIPEYYLRRIRIRELPGWPPIFEVTGREAIFPSMLHCRLMTVARRSGSSKSDLGIEMELQLEGQSFRGWFTGCPEPLVDCLEATLKQPGIAGMALRDLQEMRLIGAEESS